MKEIGRSLLEVIKRDTKMFQFYVIVYIDTYNLEAHYSIAIGINHVHRLYQTPYIYIYFSSIV